MIGKKWTLGYYDAGQFIDYNKSLYSILKGFMKLGWMEEGEPPLPKENNGREIWNWASVNSKSQYLLFPIDAYYTSNWNSKERKINVSSLIKRIKDKKDIDALLVSGTQAGKDFSTNEINIPTFVFSVSDPIPSGLIKDKDDRPFKHVHITVNPNRYYNQVLTFFEFTNFKKLGVIFENSNNGKSYSGIQVIKDIAAEKGFRVIECNSLDEDFTDKQSERDESVVKCINNLTGKIDALYLTQQGGVNSNTIPIIVKWALQNKIKTFSQAGSDEVKQGILMGSAGSSFKYVGEFESKNIIEVLKGEPIDHISQVFIDPILISLNTNTAKVIGFIPSFNLMSVVEEIF